MKKLEEVNLIMKWFFFKKIIKNFIYIKKKKINKFFIHS